MLRCTCNAWSRAGDARGGHTPQPTGGLQLKARVCAQSCPTLCDPHGPEPARLLCPCDSPGRNPGVGCHFLSQGSLPTQGLNLHFQHQQADPLPLGQLGSP